jgi:hypothetical protein
LSLVTLSLDQYLCHGYFAPGHFVASHGNPKSQRERERQKRGAMREREKKKRQRMRDKERIKGEGEGERKNQCLQEKIFPPRFHKKAQK